MDIIVNIIGVSNPNNIASIVTIIAGTKDIVPKYYMWIVKSSFSFKFSMLRLYLEKFLKGGKLLKC